MTNYDLEETNLLKWQMVISTLFLFTLIISLSLTYNQILKHEKKTPIYDDETERTILIINRSIAFLIAIAFLYINIIDKNIKNKYNQGNMKSADLQIGASAITAIATIIVLYVAVNSNNGSTQIENPEI